MQVTTENTGLYIISSSNKYIPLSQNTENYKDGIVILLDKPYKWTSADAVRKVKFRLQKFFKSKNIKVGHAGTLDPLATGMLVICIGKATKLAESFQAQEKEYLAEIELGATTPCYDLEKEVDARYPFEHISRDLIEQVIPSFLGKQEQIPPIFSAKLIDGNRAYEYARAGVEKEMKPASIEIHEMSIVSFDLPSLLLSIRCSKGTYVRSIARDIGLKLESGGHLTNLRRTRSGKFLASEALSMEDIEFLFPLQ